jgi:hypothetical protein
MANFCLTVVERQGKGRRGAANLLGIEFPVLKKLGELTATKGDEKTARKVPPTGFNPYIASEVEWMEAAVCAIIRRLGEWAARATLHPPLTMAESPCAQDLRDCHEINVPDNGIAAARVSHGWWPKRRSDDGSG